MMESSEYNSADNGEGGGKRKRSRKPKQEPLAYAFRGSRGPGNQKKKQKTPLGNDYTIMQRYPAPKIQQLPQQYNNQNSASQYTPRPTQAPVIGGGGSQHNYGASQHTNYMQTQNINDHQVPFGMPTIRISLPKQTNLPQQPYKQASSPAITFDKSLLYTPTR